MTFGEIRDTSLRRSRIYQVVPVERRLLFSALLAHQLLPIALWSGYLNDSDDMTTTTMTRVMMGMTMTKHATNVSGADIESHMRELDSFPLP